MRLVLANPNTTRAMTDRMAALAETAVPPGTTIIPMTAPRGFPYISSLPEAQVAGTICLEMLADAPPCDAAIIAAFGDPGLHAARALFPYPVVGMAEAAILTAVQLGHTFAIVTFTPAMQPWYRQSVEALGLGARFLGVRVPAGGTFDVADVATTHRAELCDLALTAARDGAEVVILGGAPLAGLATELSADLPVLLVDPILAATRQALALAGQGPYPADRLCRPAPKASSGLPYALARRFAGKGETP
jgi:allantoin racemase